MCYTIVFKNGSIRRFVAIENCHVGLDIITLYCSNTNGRYEIRKKDVASVVFYP